MKIIGHRGARGLAPENTMAALRKGLEHHVDMLEFDVRVTGDGIPVLHHDAKLSGTAKLKIGRHSYSELKEHLPGLTKLEESFEAAGTKTIFYVEVKRNEPVVPIAKTIKKGLKATGRSPESLRIASKSQKTLRELHEALPDIPVIVIEPWSGVRAHRRARELGANEISMNQLWLWWGFIRGFKNSDKTLYAYTLNDPVKARRWEKWGLGGVVTDYPDRFDREG